MDIVRELFGFLLCLGLPIAVVAWFAHLSSKAKAEERSRRALKAAEKRRLSSLANPKPKVAASRGAGVGTHADYKTTSRKGAYITAKAPEHPLATKNGWLPLHRAVLFDSLGPGPHKCYWCGVLLEWHKANGGPYNYPAIQVDHLDDNPSNNCASNLAVACKQCNLGRSKGQYGAQQQLNRLYRNERKMKSARYQARARRYR